MTIRNVRTVLACMVRCAPTKTDSFVQLISAVGMSKAPRGVALCGWGQVKATMMSFEPK